MVDKAEGLQCPQCSGRFNHTVDSRVDADGVTCRRRRQCDHCGHRFTTYELIMGNPLSAWKRVEGMQERLADCAEEFERLRRAFEAVFVR